MDSLPGHRSPSGWHEDFLRRNRRDSTRLSRSRTAADSLAESPSAPTPSENPASCAEPSRRSSQTSAAIFALVGGGIGQELSARSTLLRAPEWPRNFGRI